MDKKEFELKKKLIKLQHEHAMTELLFARGTIDLRYKNELNVVRVRSEAIERGKRGY